MNSKLLVITGLIFFSAFSFLLAAEPLAAPINATSQFTPVGYVWVMIRTTIALLVILALIYAVTFFLTRNSRSFSAGRQMTVVERLPLEPQMGLYLVKVGQRYFVLGSGGKRLNLLASINESELAVVESERIPAKPAGKFAEFLQKFSDRLKDGKN